jgi:sarcosine oxidase subunit beta
LKNYDVIIVGAGIIGLSIAWQLARRSSLKVLVLEKGLSVGEGSTGASSAVCRFRYSRDEMVHLARDGIHAYQNWPEFTQLTEPRAVFNAAGALWLPGGDTSWAATEHRRMQSLGIRTTVLDDQALRERFPAFNNCTLAADTVHGEPHDCRSGGQHFLEEDGGYMEPEACAEDLLETCRAIGTSVQFNSFVQKVLLAGGRVSGVRLADNSEFSAPLVINAAGPWCNKLLDSVGLRLPWHLTPTRIQILYLDRPLSVPGHIPVTVDMENGIYFRTRNRGEQLVVGSILEADEKERVSNPDDYNRFADEEFQAAKLHALQHRLPALQVRGKVRSYCGLYTVNEEDVHPLVGPTEVDGFYLANGFSGHGFKLAPAIGALIAQQLTGQKSAFDTGVAADFFAVDRSPIKLASKSVLA